MDYLVFTDEELVERYKNGDISCFEEIYKRYSTRINALTRTYYLVGGDEDDVRQEASCGLIQAVTDYDKSKGTFSSFAYLCMKRRVFNAIRQANGNRHKALNDSVPLLDKKADLIIEPMFEYELIEEEGLNELLVKIKELLSNFEYSIFKSFFLEGLNYKVIAENLNINSKKVDNAVQRIKSKLKKFFKE